MDKVISARVDETVANNIGSLARRLHTSKKNVIERAIELYAAQINREQKFDVFEQTFGVWRRTESAEQLVEASRKAIRDSIQRHQK